MAEQQTEGQFEPRDRVQLQAQLRENLESLGGARIGDLTDDEVKKLQIRMDVLERWALLNDAATGDMYHDDDTNLHHHHSIDVVELPRIVSDLGPEA